MSHTKKNVRKPTSTSTGGGNAPKKQLVTIAARRCAGLSNDEMRRILQCVRTGQATGGMTVFSEKKYIGKGNRNFFLVGDTVKVLVEYHAGEARYLVKDVDRFEAMTRAVMQELEIEKIQRVVLFGPGTEDWVCCRNTLAKLKQNRVVVMRYPQYLDDDSSDESDEEEEEPTEGQQNHE